MSLGLLGVALVLPGRVSMWVDDDGRTWLTDAEQPPDPSARRVSPRELSLEWGGEVLGEPLAPGESSAREDDRYRTGLRLTWDRWRGLNLRATVGYNETTSNESAEEFDEWTAALGLSYTLLGQ